MKHEKSGIRLAPAESTSGDSIAVPCIKFKTLQCLRFDTYSALRSAAAMVSVCTKNDIHPIEEMEDFMFALGIVLQAAEDRLEQLEIELDRLSDRAGEYK